jgi:hypothetical protein
MAAQQCPGLENALRCGLGAILYELIAAEPPLG